MSSITGRIIYNGQVEGDVLFTQMTLLIYGGIDVITGAIVEKGHPLEGSLIGGKILVFPEAKGSTVGSWTLLQLKKNGVAPAGIINTACEPIIATGAIMAKIPCIDQINIAVFENVDKLSIDGEHITIL
jgi:hypothetical protein